MAGITRIKINSNWHDWRTELSDRFAPIADDLYRQAFLDINIRIADGHEDISVTKEEAMSRYDWKEGIDVILQFSNGTRATLQEKYLTYWEDTATFEDEKTNGDPGAWYYCTAQYHFWGYARKYWDWKKRKVIDEPVYEFQNWMLIDLPTLHRIDASRQLPWHCKQNGLDGRRATFRYLYFDDVPKECIVARAIALQLYKNDEVFYTFYK